MVKKTMRTTAYRMIASTILVALLIVSFGYITFITRDKENAWMHDAYNKLPKNSGDVFFVGNSHSFCSINTDLLNEEYGINSFMMSASGQTLAMDYFAIKEIFRDQCPKKIYLEMSYAVHDWNTINDEMSHMFFDGMKLDRIKIEAINELIDDSSKVYFYLPIGQYHTRWQNLAESDYVQNHSSSGRYYSDHIENCWPIKVADINEKIDIPDNTLLFLDRIVALCKEEGVELILWTAPYNSLYQSEYDEAVLMESQRIYNSIYDYAEKNSIEYINLFHDIEKIDIDYSNDFLDSQHFNCFGQDKFTTYMVEAGYICNLTH